jgi:diketogulonate reductase-like aldo/keto reductase
MQKNRISRRTLLKIIGGAGLGVMAQPLSFHQTETIMKRTIPSSGEALPIVGLGTWIQFDVGASASERAPLQEVLTQMKQHGGRVIDASPMYGNSEAVVGDLTQELGIADHFFYATKVWTSGEQAGIRQMEASMQKMRRTTMDLMQIHNLVDWKTHIKTLRQWKEAGKIRYMGITHYTDGAHAQLEEIIQNEDIDFVQFNYSIRNRHAEQSLLGTARKHGVAVIINSPYEGGSLFRLVRNEEIPAWAKEYDINSWGQFFLKFILSHPAVTCAIPGTSNPKHVADNMMAGYGKLPDEAAREKMAGYIQQL